MSNFDFARFGLKLYGSSSGVGTDAIHYDNKGLGPLIVFEGAVLESKVSSISPISDFASIPVDPPVLGIPIKKEEGLKVGLSSPVIEFEKDIAQFCCPGEKNAMMVFWNCLSASEKEGFVHGLRFTKKKYNSSSDVENSIEDSIDNVKKISSVSQRNDLLLNWKDLSNKKKEKVFHKLCTSKIKKQVEANFGKNRIPFNSFLTLFPSSIEMKRSSGFEASIGLEKVGETVVSLLPEGVPIIEDNEPVVVDLEKKLLYAAFS